MVTSRSVLRHLMRPAERVGSRLVSAAPTRKPFGRSDVGTKHANSTNASAHVACVAHGSSKGLNPNNYKPKVTRDEWQPCETLVARIEARAVGMTTRDYS